MLPNSLHSDLVPPTVGTLPSAVSAGGENAGPEREAYPRRKGEDNSSSCPVCGGSHWVLAEHLIWGLVHTPDFVMGGVNYPLYLTFCDSCYYTRHFMAVPVLGDIQHKDPDQEDAEAANG